jgi:hypothetical protein
LEGLVRNGKSDFDDRSLAAAEDFVERLALKTKPDAEAQLVALQTLDAWLHYPKKKGTRAAVRLVKKYVGDTQHAFPGIEWEILREDIVLCLTRSIAQYSAVKSLHIGRRLQAMYQKA